MICLKTLDAPTTFGELAIQKDTMGRRTATVISKGLSYIFKVPLRIFRKLKRYMDDPETHQRALFFQEISIFTD